MKFVVIAAALAMTGCATTGVRVNEQQVASFKKGETTYEQIVAALGAPSYSTVTSDGSRTIIYSYAHAQTRATSFIPVVGMFAGGVDVRSSSAAFTFGPNGILRDYAVTSGGQGIKTGVGAGSQPQVPVKN